MMKIRTLATLFAVSSIALAGSVASVSASPITDSFVANARANVDFLDSSSRMAMSQATTPQLRAFAHREARDQTITGNAMVAYASAQGGAIVQGPALDPTGGLLGPIGAVASLPLDVAGNVTSDVGNGVGAVLTGRSVALGNPLAPPAPAPTLMSANEDLARLRAATGGDFDALYRSTQRDALTQLTILYRDYAQNGDDEALRSLARQELPKINRELRELNRI